LNEIAEYMYMAPASFSRFFSKATGITFVSYLIKVRLEHAVEDLLISEDTISDIALKNGFGSASQFNKQFKNSFHMSPSEYKSSVFKSGRKENMEESQQLSDELRKYKSKTRLVIVKEQKIKVQEVEIDTSKGEMLHNPWGRILNLGYTSRLLSAEYQRQIIMLKQQLNFEYGIINGLFSPELKLKDENGDSGLNFVNLDYVLDFLAENNIRPLLILDSQIMSMVKKLNENEKILCLDVFDNSEQCSQTVGRIIDHIIYRYGLREVSGWKFAVWYDTFSKNTLGIKEEFYRVWDDICKEIHTRIPEAEIGGCGLGPSVQERELIKFFTKWKKAEYVPDYLTVNSFPYRESDNPTKMNAVRRNVSEFFIEDILDFKSVLQSVGFWKVPVVVLEWNLSFVQRNYFNDMVGKAALMMKHMVQGINEVESAGYWPASDLQAGDYDAARILNGAGGLISADGICKPTFYALAFFKELQRILVSRGEHYIVTKDDRGNFCIILYNNKNLNHNYYSKPESSIDMLDDNLIFENQDTLEISLTLKEVPDKKYLVRKQVIGAEKGSVLDEWMRLGTETQLNVSDLSYLKSKSVPDRKNEEISSQNHQIVLKESLNAHEILLLQLL